MAWVRRVCRSMSIQAMPAFAARYYDRAISRLAPFHLVPFSEEVLRAFPRPARIVDAGTGPGHLPVMLALGNPCYTIVGLDLSKACLRRARQRAAEAALSGRVTFVQADLERCPLSQGWADLVLSTSSLHHWRRPVRVLRELARLLKPSGELWILDDAAEATREGRAQWLAAVRHAALPGALYGLVFSYESRFLAYSRDEVAELCRQAHLSLTDFAVSAVFFLAKARRAAP